MLLNRHEWGRKIAEWRPAAFNSTSFLGEWGISGSLLELRSTVVAMTAVAWGNVIWSGCTVELFTGWAMADVEISAFRCDATTISPLGSILITPSEVLDDSRQEYRNQHFWRGGVRYGDVLADAWNIYTGGDIWLSRMAGGVLNYHINNLHNAYVSIDGRVCAQKEGHSTVFRVEIPPGE